MPHKCIPIIVICHIIPILVCNWCDPSSSRHWRWVELTSNLPVNNPLFFSYLWSPFPHLSWVKTQPTMVSKLLSIYIFWVPSIQITGSPHLLLRVWFLSKRHHCSTWWTHKLLTGNGVHRSTKKARLTWYDVKFGHMTVSKNSTISRDGSQMIHPAHNPSKKWRQFGARAVNSELPTPHRA
jgi:hypothetical protein